MGKHKITRRDGTTITFLVDDIDDPLVRAHRRCVDSKGYIARNIPHPLHQGKWATSRLHREILGLVFGDGQEADHINGIKTDNRRSNLRIVTHAENNQNHKRLRRGLSSRYQGVSWDKRAGKWRASIKVNGKQRHLGRFTSEEDAHQAYLEAKRLHHPAFVEGRLTAGTVKSEMDTRRKK